MPAAVVGMYDASAKRPSHENNVVETILKKTREGKCVVKQLRSKPILSIEQESQLKITILFGMDARLVG